MTPDEHRQLDAQLDEEDRDRASEAELLAMADTVLFELDCSRAQAVEEAEIDIERQLANLERELES
jgi:hypothetical protein